MKKYKGYYYTTRINIDGEFKFYIRNKERQVLIISEETYGSRKEANEAAEVEIDEHYY